MVLPSVPPDHHFICKPREIQNIQIIKKRSLLFILLIKITISEITRKLCVNYPVNYLFPTSSPIPVARLPWHGAKLSRGSWGCRFDSIRGRVKGLLRSVSCRINTASLYWERPSQAGRILRRRIRGRLGRCCLY